MSVIVRDEEGKILILCKGADRFVIKYLETSDVSLSTFVACDYLPNSFSCCSVMFERLAKNGREFEEKTREHVNEYAEAGLRTLILAYRELDEEEYKDFNEKLTEAKNSVSADQETLIDEVAEKTERDLILLGATAVEDKLQNGVG